VFTAHSGLYSLEQENQTQQKGQAEEREEIAEQKMFRY